MQVFLLLCIFIGSESLAESESELSEKINWIENSQIKDVEIKNLKVLPIRTFIGHQKVRVLLQGIYKAQDGTLMVNDIPVKLSKSGVFRIQREIIPDSEKGELTFVSISPYGKVERGLLSVDLPKDPTTGPSGWTFSLGAGISLMDYTEGSAVSYSSKVITLKGSAGYLFLNGWQLGATVFSNVFTLSKNLAEDAKFMGYNLRVGKPLTGPNSSWSITPYVGLYYVTMSVTNDQFGVSGLSGPQVFLVARHALKNNHVFSSSIKFAPVSASLAVYQPFDNRELALGLSYSLPVRKNARAWTFSVDAAQLKLLLFGGTIESKTMSFGVSIPFGN